MKGNKGMNARILNSVRRAFEMTAMSCALCGCSAAATADPPTIEPAPAPVEPQMPPHATESTDASTPPPPPPPPPPAPKLYGINQVLGSGQSLALGVGGTPVLTSTQPFANRMFVGGVTQYAETASPDYSSLVPLTERGRESMYSSLANLVTDRSAALGYSHDALVSSNAVSGFSFRQLQRGTVYYAEGIKQITEGRSHALSLGKTHGVTAVTLVHGEADGQNFDGPGSGPNPTYDVDVLKWQADYESDIKAVTGQTGTLPMFHTQMSAIAGSDIPLAQLRAHLAAPGKVILVGPKYFLPTVDGVHLTNHGYQQLGEYYAKAYARVVVEQKPWEPLRPVKVSLVGSVIVIEFLVPAPPIVFDDGPHGVAPNKGFDLVGGGGVGIVPGGIVIVGNTVHVPLTGVPIGPMRIRYAQLSENRGNLRDSDTSVKSRFGYDLFNWAVHSDNVVQ